MMSGLDVVMINELAQRLRGAYDSYEPIAPIREELESKGPGDLDAAYAVQQLNTEYWVGKGRKIVGRKIGLTSEAVQHQLGVDQPDYGALFEDMRLFDGEVVPCRRVLQPRIEAEVALVLARPIESPDVTVDQLADAIDYLLPSLEVVGSRIADWRISIYDTIADNASSGMFVLGKSPVDPGSVDLGSATMRMEIDGKVVSEGVGAACLGHPYNAAVWLARRMVANGTPLQAGDVLMTGALGPMVDLEPGAQVVAVIDGLGKVTTSREEIS